MGFYVGGEDRDVLGSAASTALIATGANAIVPGSGAVVGTALALFGGLFGGGGKTDQQRMARVSYFYNLAANGNVGAAQVMAGAIPDVSGNEQPYWIHALEQLQATNPAAYAAAQAAGPVKFTGTGDSATSYPHMQAYAMNWAAQNQPVVAYASPANPTPGTYTPSSSSSSSTNSRPAYQLPPVTTTANWNWWPVVAGVTGIGVTAALLLSNRPRGRR